MAGCHETCSVWRQQTSTTPIGRVATEGMADQAAPEYKSTTPTKRVATEGMADRFSSFTISHYSIFFFLLREKCWCWCGLRHCWRVVVAVPPWVFSGFAGLGQLSQTSDRLTSCGFPDRQSRPSSATGAGGF